MRFGTSIDVLLLVLYSKQPLHRAGFFSPIGDGSFFPSSIRMSR